MADLSTSIEPTHEAYVEPEMEESGHDTSDLLSTVFGHGVNTVVKPPTTVCGCCFC